VTLGAARGTPRGWLIDTNVVSELRKGPRCAASVWAWATNVPRVACHLSRVSIAEIRFGITRAPDPSFRVELEAWMRDGLLPWFGERILEVDERVLGWNGKGKRPTTPSLSRTPCWLRRHWSTGSVW
jgi:predicted nucleic acid-binding protein